MSEQRRPPARLPFDSRHREDEETPVNRRRPPTLEERLDKHEERLDGLEDWIGNTSASNREIAAEAKRVREKRIDRAWHVGLALVLAAIFAALRWVHFGPPEPATPAPKEAHP